MIRRVDQSARQSSIGATDQLLIASALVDRAPLLAEQYGVVVSPTLAVFHHGDHQGQMSGFLPAEPAEAGFAQ